MGRPIDKIDTNKDEAKYNISPSSVIQNMPTKPDYGEDWKKAYYENAYSQGYINGYLKGKKDQMQQKIGRWVFEERRRLVDETDDGSVYRTEKWWSCSECGYAKGYQISKPSSNYCENCGAKMREDGDAE